MKSSGQLECVSNTVAIVTSLALAAITFNAIALPYLWTEIGAMWKEFDDEMNNVKVRVIQIAKDTNKQEVMSDDLWQELQSFRPTRTAREASKRSTTQKLWSGVDGSSHEKPRTWRRSTTQQLGSGVEVEGSSREKPRTWRRSPFRRQISPTKNCNCKTPNSCPSGPRGEKGPPGHAGTKGIDGPNGLNGVDYVLKVKRSAYDVGIENMTQAKECWPCPPGPSGLQGPIGTIGLRGMRGQSGQDGSSPRNGAPGPPGEMGSPGPAGIEGITGERGRPGKDGTMAIGIKGPKGRKGMVGIPGEVGDRGEGLPPGSIGQPGTDGDAGFKGTDGKPGQMGPPGDAGIPGRDGQYCSCPKRADLVSRFGAGRVEKARVQYQALQQLYAQPNTVSEPAATDGHMTIPEPAVMEGHMNIPEPADRFIDQSDEKHIATAMPPAFGPIEATITVPITSTTTPTTPPSTRTETTLPTTTPSSPTPAQPHDDTPYRTLRPPSSNVHVDMPHGMHEVMPAASNIHVDVPHGMHEVMPAAVMEEVPGGGYRRLPVAAMKASDATTPSSTVSLNVLPIQRTTLTAQHYQTIHPPRLQQHVDHPHRLLQHVDNPHRLQQHVDYELPAVMSGVPLSDPRMTQSSDLNDQLVYYPEEKDLKEVELIDGSSMIDGEQQEEPAMEEGVDEDDADEEIVPQVETGIVPQVETGKQQVQFRQRARTTNMLPADKTMGNRVGGQSLPGLVLNGSGMRKSSGNGNGDGNGE